MEVPKQVKVGAVYYEVVLVPRCELDRESNWGVAQHRNRRILIAADLPVKDRAATLLHEIIHCVYCVFNIAPDDAEERTVMALEYGITAVMHDNPGLFAAIEQEMA